jgi:RNA polymerase sigma-70 factor, ECF subfamily
VSRWRTAKRAATAWREHAGPSTTPEPSPDQVALIAALRQLPDTQRVAIVLHHLCDVSVDDIADEMGTPVGTVKARLSRGRAALLPLLHDDDRTEARRG